MERTITTKTLDRILAFGNPFAVLKIVVLGMILSSKNILKRTAAFWGLPHIGQEILKLTPAAAYPNSFGSVILEIWALRIRAPRLHIGPDTMDAGSFKAVRASTYTSQLVPKAVAALIGFFSDQAAGLNLNLPAAVALAMPESDSFATWGSTCNQKSPRAETGQIYNSHLL
jgi:hypothetical protein